MSKYIWIFVLAIAYACHGQSQAPETKSPQAKEEVKPEVVLTEASDFKSLQDSIKNLQILDVRTPREWEEGILENAVMLDYFDKNHKEALSQTLDPNAPVLVYCRSGGRSAKSAQILIDLGFTEVYDLKGGVTVWKATGRPLVAPQTQNQGQ